LAATTTLRPIRSGAINHSKHSLVSDAALETTQCDRARSGVPSDSWEYFYSQRVIRMAVLIFTEADRNLAGVSAGINRGAPGIYSEEQVKALARVTEAVHTRGGYMSSKNSGTPGSTHQYRCVNL